MDSQPPDAPGPHPPERPTDVLDEDLVAFLLSGLSFAVATRDGGLCPEGVRAWALTVDPDRTHVEVYVYEPAATRTMANLARWPQMAVVCDEPTEVRACQLKGFCVGSRLASPEERPELERQLSLLCIALDAIGIPATLYRAAVRTWPAVVLRMRVTDVFAQNPGPGAGAPLQRGTPLGPTRPEPHNPGATPGARR